MTGHPLCTQLYCECAGDIEPGEAGRFLFGGAAVCVCHPQAEADRLGVERFQCAAAEAIEATS